MRIGTKKNAPLSDAIRRIPTLPPSMFAKESLFACAAGADENEPSWGFDENLSEAEGRVMMAAREWNKAQTDPVVRARLTGWADLRYNVEWFLTGGMTEEHAIQGWGKEEGPAMLTVIRTIAYFYPLFVPTHFYEKRSDEVGTAGEGESQTESVSDAPGADLKKQWQEKRDRAIALVGGEGPTGFATDFIDIVLDYAGLSSRESERAYNAVQDAKRRDHESTAGDTAYDARYRLLESLGSWAEDMESMRETVNLLAMQDLSEEQHDRLIRAYAAIKGVFAETEARADLLYRDGRIERSKREKRQGAPP